MSHPAFTFLLYAIAWLISFVAHFILAVLSFLMAVIVEIIVSLNQSGTMPNKGAYEEIFQVVVFAFQEWRRQFEEECKKHGLKP